MTIEDIIIKFRGKTFSSNEEAVEWLESSFISLLDEIKRKAIEQSTGGADRYEISYITIDKLFNIINSHR